MAVMHEKHLGLKSRWAGYLGFLPEDLTHMPMMWKVRATACLLAEFSCFSLEIWLLVRFMPGL